MEFSLSIFDYTFTNYHTLTEVGIRLRQALAQAEATIPHQRGKQTERPTLRWVMQCFQSVHLIWVEGLKWAIKLNDVQRHILRFLGSTCQKYYFLC